MSSGQERSHRKVRVESRINPSLLKRRVAQARRTRRNIRFMLEEKGRLFPTVSYHKSIM